MLRMFTLPLLLLLGSVVYSQSNFYDLDQIQKVELSFEADNWKYLLDSLRYNGDELQQVQVTINDQKIENAGVRYRDERSFTPNGKKNGLYIDLKGKDYQGYNIIDLSSALRDPSMVREVLAYEVAGTYFNAPKANFAKVFINDEYYGIFVNIEAAATGMLKRIFNNDTGDLVYAEPHNLYELEEGCSSKIDGSLQYEEKQSCIERNFNLLQGNFDALQALAKELNEASPNLEEILDVDATLWMLAFNNIMVNLNSYSGQYAQNFYLYRNLNDKKFTPLLGQMNLAFGSFKNDGLHASDLKTPELLTLPTNLHANNETRPLISKLLANDEYRMQYNAHIRTLLVEQLLSGKMENRAKELQNAIRSSVAMDTGKYYNSEEFSKSLDETIGKRSRIPGLATFITKRANWLEKQAVYTYLPPEIINVGVQGRQRFSSTLINEFRIHASASNYPKKVYVYYRFNGEEAFSMMEMKDDGSHYDEKANDGVYGAIVKPAEGQIEVEYYILAQNAKAAAFSPAHYNFEQYSTNLTEVNK